MTQPELQRQLAFKLREEMTKLNISALQLAKRANYGQNTVGRLLRGENAGSLDLWQNLFDALGVDIVIITGPKQLTEDQLEELVGRRSNGGR